MPEIVIQKTNSGIEKIIIRPDVDTLRIWELCKQMQVVKSGIGEYSELAKLEQEIEILREKYSLENFKLQ